jgi:trk system potassium uptake protein TrkH
MQLRPVIYALGMMILLVTAAMIPCALIDIADGTDKQHVFVMSGAISFLVGSLLWVMARSDDLNIGQREAFLLTVSIWVVINAVGALPFLVSGYSITDAFFESVSGMTTTGATVLVGLDTMPRGLLLWRSILHWIGGIIRVRFDQKSASANGFGELNDCGERRVCRGNGRPGRAPVATP